MASPSLKSVALKALQGVTSVESDKESSKTNIKSWGLKLMWQNKIDKALQCKLKILNLIMIIVKYEDILHARNKVTVQVEN